MDEVHWWEYPIFDDEGDAWRRMQHRKERVARFLAAVRCIPLLKRWASRAPVAHAMRLEDAWRSASCASGVT